MKTLRTLSTMIGAGALAFTLAACGGNATPANTAAPGGDGSAPAGGASGTITMGYLPAWTDGLSTAYLLENQLEQMGYTVEHEGLSEAAPLYVALSRGDVDIYPSAWPEVTHASYMEQYSADIEDLGAYYDNAKLTIAVPEYTDIDSIEDLAADPARFGGRIVGIEPGAGLTKATQEQVIPQYGLEGSYELVTSSTTAMLAELQKATDAQEDIVVTLWRPFWANSSFPVKDLEDPKGALGDAEGLHFLATKGFEAEFPEAAAFIKQIKLTDDQYGQLEDMVVNEYGEGKEAEAIDAWLEANPDVLPKIEA